MNFTMNPEQAEHHILEIIRAECKRHGHGVEFMFLDDCVDPEDGSLRMRAVYDLNKRARLHAAWERYLSAACIGAGIGAIIGELTHVNVPCEGPLVIFALCLSYLLHVAVLAQHRDTIENWLGYLHQVLFERGYDISSRCGVTVIGFRSQ